MPALHEDSYPSGMHPTATAQPGGAGTKKKLTAEDAEDTEDTEEKTLIQCFETSAFLCVLRG